MGPFSTAASFSHARYRSHIPPWNLGKCSCWFARGLLPSALENGALRDHAGLEIAPERHRQLARHGHDHDPLDAAFRVADALAEPDAQSAIGLVAQPQPGQFDHGLAGLGIARLADALLAHGTPAAERAGWHPDIAANLAAIIERAVEHLADQH